MSSICVLLFLWMQIFMYTHTTARLCVFTYLHLCVCACEYQGVVAQSAHVNAAGFPLQGFLFASNLSARDVTPANYSAENILFPCCDGSFSKSLLRSWGGQLIIMRFRQTETSHISTYTLKSCVTLLLHGR